MGRPTRHAVRMRKKRLQESNRDKTLRLQKKRQKYAIKCKSKTVDNSDVWLSKKLTLSKIGFLRELKHETQHSFNISPEHLTNGTQKGRLKRKATMRIQQRKRRLNETKEERSRRLSQMQDSAENRRKKFSKEDFESAINVYADNPCKICNKSLYPQQRTMLQTQSLSHLLPNHILILGNIVACTRCANNLKKQKIPSQASWNKMNVMRTPPELADLTDIDQRLLSRVIPFLNIIKVKNRFSQDWCKGQVILFAKDIVELAEQLPNQLNQSGIFIITESLDKLQRSRQFQIDMGRLQRALKWLILNNSLYRDVRPAFSNVIDISEVTQIAEDTSVVTKIVAQQNESPVLKVNRYTNINNNASILRGSFNQDSDRFHTESRGKQCMAIATVACVAFHTQDSGNWCVSDIDYILILGDRYYRECIASRKSPNTNEVNTDYLAARELLSEITFNNSKINIEVEYETNFNGHIVNDFSNDGFPNLKNALIAFFREHRYGILTANALSVAVSYDENTKYLLFDSHSRGPKGCIASSRGVACCMRFSNLDSLHAILLRNLYNKRIVNRSEIYSPNIYSLTPMRIFTRNRSAQGNETDHISLQINSNTVPNHNNENKIDLQVIYTTSMLRSIDDRVPALSNIVSAPDEDFENNPVRLVNIQRKTAPPLNLERERRTEELGWYFLFPDGKNGFGESREIPITPLDYFQARIMGQDTRFNRPDYLFFALSVVEYFRTKSNVSIACRMRQGENTPQGLVDNMHLTMRNIRGSASYWKRCCSELIAMVRSLGPPAWFVTFSCNDLNWTDMIKSLLIADGRNANEAQDLSFSERLSLVQRYPVIIARQFTIRVNALIRFLKKNPECLGGHMQDFWYRIEFQNRGSPHLHMLIWIANIPDFQTPAGMATLEEVVSCSINPESNDLREIVKNCQIHKHTSTCYKDRKNCNCRFGFPKPITERTVFLGPDEALKNSGRFCLLKRTSEETMINNYNPTLLNIWQGNMDIQPCGNVTAVSYYVAKYASKCEPYETGEVVKEAIMKAKRSGGSTWSQLFAVSMAILSQRLVSAAECAYRLCHLPLKMSSRKTVFVNSCKPEQRYRILRFEQDETSVFNNIFDRYVQRPDILENLSLAEFAVRYETVSGTAWTEEDGDHELIENLDTEPSKFIRLRDNTRMRVRNKPAVLRTRYYTLNSDKEGYFYSILVCHIPFRNENELLSDNETAEACFLRRQKELRPLLKNVNAEDFAHAEQMIQVALAQAVALNAARYDSDIDLTTFSNIQADEENIVEPVNYDEITEEAQCIPHETYMNMVEMLNIQQRQLFRKISSAIENDLLNESNQMLLFITGGAGSGKSFLLKLIVEHIKRCYSPTVDALVKPTFVEVASLTGVAARQIFGKTLHSVFSLPIEKGRSMTFQRMSGERLQQERQKWRYINWLVIDEISMVSYENLRIINLRLQEFKNNEKLFGGVNILLFGDIMQLPPVKGHWCFIQPPWCAAEINLWHQFSFFELTMNMRQRDDTEFIDLLNSLRFGEMTINQLQLLCERRRVPLCGEFDDGIAVRIFPTLKLVDHYNQKMTEILSTTRRVYDIVAIDESREAATYGKKPPSNVISTDVNNCGGLLHSIKLSEGSRVMLRRNISVCDGLVNGAMGVIKKFIWPALRREQLESGEQPDAILIKFDDETIGNRVKDTNGYVSVASVNATFQATKGYGDVERRMVPLILSWAVTVHKLQGTTLNKAVIDLGKNLFSKGQAYVALSRVKSLEGLALCDLEPNKLLNKPHDEKALDEMQRLRALPT